jgi:hypothetical protein
MLLLPQLTIYFAYANQPDALRHQLDTMSAYHRDIRDRLSIAVGVGGAADGSSTAHPTAHHIICDRVAAAYCDKLHIRLLGDDAAIASVAFPETRSDLVIRTHINEVCTERALARSLMNLYQAIAKMLLEQCHAHLESADA